LNRHEYVAGRTRLRAKVRRYKPPVVAMVGVTVFRAMFPEKKGAVSLGLQEERLSESAVFVLPNPSGRNANFSYAQMLAAFKALEKFVGGGRRSAGPRKKYVRGGRL
jgi:TDG/mug DNA glycosylase family protein